jgi:flagellar hook-associated protein 3 FlgL
MMRISTNTIYQSGITRINNIQSDQAKLQEQISTGRRISSPSDDPVAAARALEIAAAQSSNTKFADTRQTAQLKLNTLESNLNSVTSLLVSTQSSLVAAGNGALSDTERGFLGAELKSNMEALLGLANTKDASGNYLYAGYKTSTVPFVATATGADYMGDSNQQLLQVDTQRQMAINASGDNVFQANGNDVFASLSAMITLLNTPITDAATQATYNAGLATTIDKLKNSVDNVLTVRTDVGQKLHEIDELDTAGSDRELQYSKSLSNIQDTDYASALSDFAKHQTIMEAAQKSFVQMTSLSLFTYIP